MANSRANRSTKTATSTSSWPAAKAVHLAVTTAPGDIPALGQPEVGTPDPAASRTPVIFANRKNGRVALQRMDNVGIVVESLDAAISFFAELGLELEGRAM